MTIQRQVYEATLPYVNVRSMFRYAQNGAKDRLRSKCNSLSFLYKTGVSMILENICDEVNLHACLTLYTQCNYVLDNYFDRLWNYLSEQAVSLDHFNHFIH